MPSFSVDLTGAKRCPNCKYGIIEKHFTQLGFLLCLGMTFCCGAGIVIARCLRSTHCNDCYAKALSEKAPAMRESVLFIRDKSALPKPPTLFEQNDFSEQPVPVNPTLQKLSPVPSASFSPVQ